MVDALVTVRNEAEKAVSMKEVMVRVYFDINKAYGSLWRGGLLVKMDKMGVWLKVVKLVLDFHLIGHSVLKWEMFQF